MYQIATLILLHLFLGLSSCKRYDLPQGWTVKTGESEQLEAADGVGYFELIHAQPDVPILSDNGTFGLCFFRFKNGTATYFSLVMGASYKSNSSTAAVVVWAGNRDKPIHGDASLRLGEEKTVELVDSTGKVAWTSIQGVLGIDMDETGALAFYDADGNVTWRSFDDSKDFMVLLEGQKLYQGQQLWSTMNSSTMEVGNFVSKMEVTGVTFYVVYGDKTMEPYIQWYTWNSNQANITCPSYETVLTFNRSTIHMFYERNRDGTRSGPGNFPKCGPDLSAVITGIVGSLNYLKFNQTGHLVLASLDPQRLVWQQSPVSVINNLVGACFPMTCGPHSLCKGDGECECLINQGGSGSGGQCTLPAEKPLPCNDLEKKNHRFLNVTGASYFANKYVTADTTSTLDNCWNLCLSNCSCKAFFYSSGLCYFMSTLRGSWSADSSSSAFLKLQNTDLVFPKLKEHQDTVIIASGVGGGTLVILVCMALLGLYMWKKQASKIANVLAAALQGSLHQYSYKELKTATSNLSRTIGRGGSGLVFEGILSDGTKVAVKKLQNTSQKEFISEVNSIGSVSHMNIVKLCGFCAESSHRLLVYEFVVNGSLDKWLFNLFNEENGKGILDWKTRYNVALGVARALSYLHEESKQLIMHLDIKPENILLDEQFVPKLSDFGVSKLMADREASQGTTNVRGTPGYLAPEWLLNSVATKKCDVYSYGMVLLELIGGRRNYKPNLSNKLNDADDEDTLAWYFPAWVVKKLRENRLYEVVDQRIVEEAPEKDVRRLIRAALWCIQENPTRRPTMKTVVQMLEGHMETQEPPLTFHFALPSPGIISISTTSSSAQSKVC